MDARESLNQVLNKLSENSAKDRTMGRPYNEILGILNLTINYHKPRYLYKYFNTNNYDRSIQDLLKSRLYLSNPTTFNDDYDVRPTINKHIIEKRLRKQITEQNIAETHLYYRQFFPEAYDDTIEIYNKMIRAAGGFSKYKEHYISDTLMHLYEHIEKFRNMPRCACLAEEVDSTLMWGLYASKHAGFVAAYETSREAIRCTCKRCEGAANVCSGVNDFPFVLAPIIYKGRRDVTAYSDVYGGSTSLIPYITDHLLLAVLNATLYKDSTWSEEREWRLVTLACGRSLESTMYARMSPSALYLGAKALESTCTKLRKVSQELQIPIFKEKMTYDDSASSMQFIQVD